MKLYYKEKLTDKNNFKRFVSRHSSAFTDWEILHRAHKGIYDEIPLDNFLDLIARDYQWYTTFLNNIKIRLTK